VTKPPRLDLWADFNNEDDDGMVHFRVLPRNDPDSQRVLADASNG
jgi:hypothetical protein